MPDSFDALVPYGWSDRVLALFSALGDTELVPGRVVRTDRRVARTVLPDGTTPRIRTAVACAVGDWVAIAERAIHNVLPRWSELTRMDPNGTVVQVLAANVDLVIITAPADRLSAARVERELAIAWESGARALVALTKSDVASPDTMRSLHDRLTDTEVLCTSARTGQGIDDLRAALQPNVTAVLLGPSGAGKSTLANALLGTETLATAEVREGDHRGRHTTTSRQLVAVPTGGVLIDTPGLRSLGLTGGDGLDHVFSEIDELAAGCRFRDCHHDTEPGCAVTAAVANGELDADRLASFQKLTGEITNRQ